MNNASGHTLADAVRGAPPKTHSSEGGGVWAEYLPKAALMSNDLFLDDVNVLVPVWLGGRGDRPGFPTVGPTNYLLKTLQFKRICPTQACTTP